jgi:hypothetical protein
MHFSEPITDFHSRLNTDDGAASIDVQFSPTRGQWHLTVDNHVARETLADMVRHIHDEFYAEEDGYLDNWLTVVGAAKLGKKVTLTLKTVDRL